MFVDYRGSVLGLMRWQWKSIGLFVLSATLVVFFDQEHPELREYLSIPPFALAVVGGAIGIFVSFRTNSSYDRWWEGRKLWGRLINSSRMWSSQVLAYLPKNEDGSPSELQHRLVRRHVAYVHCLRALLRAQDPFADEDVNAYLSAKEKEVLPGQTNVTHALLQEQLEDLAAEARAETITQQQLQQFDETIAKLLDIQGGCERIKKTPFPRGYGFVANRLIVAFGLLFPLGLVGSLGWIAVPISALACMGFVLISEVGRTLEDPFTLFWPALPLFALSKTIEANLVERLGVDEVPAIPKQDAKGILM